MFFGALRSVRIALIDILRRISQATSHDEQVFPAHLPIVF
jgi:hypothetical protein